MTGATSKVWAADKTTDKGFTVLVEKLPNSSAGTVGVGIATNGKVTLTVAPASGYFVNKNTIKAEKMIAASSAPRRADVMSNYLTISGDNEASSSSPQNYTFEIPSGFTGANVTVTFYKKSDGFVQIYSLDELKDKINATENTTHGGNYELMCDVSGSGFESIETFTGTLDGGLHKITNLSEPLFKTVNGAKIRNIIIEGVSISGNGNVGAIACNATGASRIYNCGILPTHTDYDTDGSIKGFSGSSVGGTDYVGGLVGQLIGGESGSPRVINCYSYATITGGNVVAGLVGYIGGTDITQGNLTTVPMVVNCMFYGDITSGSTKYPVYGGNAIKNDATNGVNPYCYFRRNATFDNNYTAIGNYNRSWPAEEKNLTRFEYYRSILNSNKQICTYWVTDKKVASTNANDAVQTAADTALIAKWVLDETIAPYPILKKWGKYYSVINRDPKYRINSETKLKESRSVANEWEGKDLGTLKVTIVPNVPSDNDGGDASTKKEVPFVITDMDTLNCDYGYYKIQLPYYNEQFGNPSADPATQWAKRYGGNYQKYVVTGWEITDISGGVSGVTNSTGTDANGVAFNHTFTANWESGYNFADRYCTDKDKYSVSGRVFAQGGYYYVPKDVESITITAHWGKAVYLANRGCSVDRVNVTNAGYKSDSPFAPAGTVPSTFKPISTGSSYTVYNDLQNAIKALGGDGTNSSGLTVYDQAIVLIGNHQVKNGGKNNSNSIGYNLDSKWHPFTFMSADFDLDNEPDYCLQFQFRENTDRPGIQPIRFDFLPVIELGLAVRHNSLAYAIGVFVPQGHFEITETAFMRTTQFEWDCGQHGGTYRLSSNAPVILNGGEFDQLAVRYVSNNYVSGGRTGYFLLGGNLWFHRFAPGAHPHKSNTAQIRLCAVNAIGGDFPEFYLSGLYKPGLAARNDQGNPHCYIDGGRFGSVYGAGYDKVKGNVTFKVNHALIDEFYGGGINGSNPIGGNIDVTIDNSRVNKYCGGPVVGKMPGQTVTTHATGTTFGVFYGGGNGGNSYYRDLQFDGDKASSHIGTWTDETYNWDVFKPLKVKDDDINNANKGYHAEYEFEVFNQSNGVQDQITQRGFIRWIQFGITTTGNVSNTLTDCTIENNFYGGGNLATVDGTVTSKLINTKVNGSVFGAGYSAAIPTFQVHDKENKTFPSMDFAGTITDGYIPYAPTVYEWTNDLNGKTEAQRKADPTYQKDGKWYCYTWNSLKNLGAVTGNVSLTIDGKTVAGDDGKVMTVGGSVYGGGEESGVDGNTEVTVSGGTIGAQGNGGVEYGNVYGGGKGKRDNVLAGLVKGTSTVTISGTPTIYHNVYGGGAYGSVGEFTYDANGMPTARKENTTGGVCNVTITGGTFGWNGKENGMIFGSSRGDVGAPEAIEDKLAWVYSTQVTIGDANVETAPTVKGSVYGGGENGHVFQNAVVNIAKGTIGIAEGETITNNNGTPDDTSDDISYSGAAYPYRGNLYGGGCGTDKYYTYTTGVENPYDGNGDAFNPLAGVVYGDATITMTGGQVVHNIYGAGAMGSVGKTTTDGKTSGGTTTINISGGIVGADGTHGDGNVFGAARGDADATSNEFALVRKETSVSIIGGEVKGNVYGGGELGCVGVYDISSDYRTFTWKDTDGTTNTANNTKNTGICNVTVNGASAVINGHVFGAGKGKDDTFWCEKGIAYSTNVSVQNGTVAKNVYGGGEVGRVETDTKVKIGDGDGTANGTAAPTITGSVFGGGAGVETHGYSALVRGNTTVNVEGNAAVGHSVYGGGEIASVGKYGLDNQNMPSILQGGGYCYVTVKGYATITKDVFGAGEGVKSHFDKDNVDESKRSRRMTLKSNWQELEGADRFAWDYLPDETEYAKYLETLALATHPEVTIDGNASIGGSVFGGGELGLTKGSVIVNIQGGTIAEDVYGGGSLANTNTTSTVAKKDANGNLIYEGNVLQTEEVHPTTTVNLKGGTVNRNVYGGGLGQLAQDAVTGVKYSEEEAAAYNTAHSLSEGDEGYKTTADWKVEPQDAVTAIEAKVYGNILVELNKPTDANDDTTYGDCEVKRNIFGCNNLNGSPQKKVEVHVYKTVKKNESGTVIAKQKGSYELTAVYGGGNMAAYVPVDALSTDEATKASATTNVIIDGCGLTSIKQVYGGGNAASTPATNLTINGTFEIEEAFGGGNGKDDLPNGDPNPGANVGFYAYAENATDAQTPKDRADHYGYGSGKASLNIYGGTIHRVFGGSNTKGNVRQTAVTMLEEVGGCDFCVDEAYGGGKSAPMDAEAKLLMACIPGLNAAYGGAEAADIQGNVSLTITNGRFSRVFGGNNLSGTIRGAITVNVEEVGCKPIIIGELYGGGNEAGYSVYGYKQMREGGELVWKPRESASDNTADGEVDNLETPYGDPRVNVKSFTSIGTVYGGGYGETAVMVGNPTVNVSVVEGAWKDYAGESSHYEEEGYEYNATGYKGETITITDSNGTTTHDVELPNHAIGKIGAIGQVFGGGNAAPVKGNTTVNIGTLEKVFIKSYVEKAVTAGTSLEGLGLYTRSGAGTVASPYRYMAATGTAEEGTKYYEETTVETDVVGVDIRGNVYGGGNNAKVTGNTNVTIGKKEGE